MCLLAKGAVHERGNKERNKKYRNASSYATSVWSSIIVKKKKQKERKEKKKKNNNLKHHVIES